MNRGVLSAVVICACAAGLMLLSGCVERSMKIDTRPQGARVFVNDEEVGQSPLKFSFLWYGDYDIVVRKEGYETLKTHHRVSPPWYQLPPIDLVTECFIPGTLKDVHELPVISLTPAPAPPAGEVVERAVELRDRALYEEL